MHSPSNKTMVLQGAMPLVIIAGAAGSIGRQIALQLSDHYTLGLLDQDADGIAEVRDAIEHKGGHAHAFAIDITDSARVAEAFTSLTADNPLHSVVIAVGTTSGGSIESLSDAEWDSCMESCLTTVFRLIRETVREFGDRGGTLCVLGSVQAAHPVPGFPAYGAAKAAVASLVRQVACEYGHQGIRANLVTPGWTETPHTLSRLERGGIDQLIDATPLRQLVQPEDIAATVDFLLSPAARKITGTDIVVDGGAQLLTASSALRAPFRSALGLGWN